MAKLWPPQRSRVERLRGEIGLYGSEVM